MRIVYRSSVYYFTYRSEKTQTNTTKGITFSFINNKFKFNKYLKTYKSWRLINNLINLDQYIHTKIILFTMKKDIFHKYQEKKAIQICEADNK